MRVEEQDRETLLQAAGHGKGLLPPEATGLLILEGKPNAAALFATAHALINAMPVDTLPPHHSLPAGSHMRLRINSLFVGRREELLGLANALKGADTTVALGQVVASTGLGGLGKTQLAVEFVHRYGCYFAGGVFWVSFASAEDIPPQIASCAGPAFEALSVEQRIELVRRAWQSSLPRLLVFDNCEEEALIDEWRPSSGGCRVLVTSRRLHWSPTLGVTVLPLDLLPRPDSIELLRRYRPDLAPDDIGLDAIAEELGDLPLALHLAGSHLRAYRVEVSLDLYLAELRNESVVQHASLLGRGLEKVPSPTHHVQGVAQTFAICLQRLHREDEVDAVAIALLARMACMAPGEPVPRDLLGRTLEEVEPCRRADGLRRLGAVGLVDEGEGWLRLHRLLVHFVRHECLGPQAQAAVDRVLVQDGVAAADRNLTGSALATTLPHLAHVAAAGFGDRCDPRRAVALSNAAGRAMQYAGNLDAARVWRERALITQERARGPGHPDTAECLNNLALVLHDQGQFAAARPLYERALMIRERVLGPDDVTTSESLNNLAGLLQDQGELDDAKSLFERALSIRERVLGQDHPRYGASLNNLALLLHCQGELGAARALLERALAIRERALGRDHPRTATSLNNLARVLKDQGELNAARLLHERALAIRHRSLGADHPSTGRSLNDLAVLLKEQGDLTTAKALLERALTIRRRMLGPEHPLTAASLIELATLLVSQGDATAARPILECALGIRERVLGPDHPDTLTTGRALAELRGRSSADG